MHNEYYLKCHNFDAVNPKFEVYSTAILDAPRDLTDELLVQIQKHANDPELAEVMLQLPETHMIQILNDIFFGRLYFRL